MATGKVMNALIGASNKTKFPSMQGSQWSCNIYYGRNGKDEYMESLPGLKWLDTIDEDKKCRGAYVSTIGLEETHSPEDMFAVIGYTLYRFGPNGNRTAIGSVADNGSRISFAETGGPRALLLVCDGSGLYYYDLLQGGALKPIQMPLRISQRGGNVVPTHVSVVGGSIVINDVGSGYCYYSKPYPLNADTRTMYVMDDDKPAYESDGVTVKTETVQSDLHVFEDDYHVEQYFNTESSSDNINAIYAVGPTLYVFGKATVEIWQRGSGEYEDWIRTSYTAQNSFGLEAPHSVASSGSIVYFVASGAQYGKAVMRVAGTQFDKVSEDWLEHKLLNESTESAYGFCYSVADHNFYVLQLNAIGETWVYDSLDGGWHQRTSRGKMNGIECQWRVGGLAYYREKFFAFTNDGTMCQFGIDYWYEDYSETERLPMVRHRQTPVVVDNLRPFVLEELAIECNVGSWEDYSIQPQMLLEVSRDGGNTFGNVRSSSLGKTGDYSHRVRFLNLGRNRLCVLRVTYSHPTELILNRCSIRAESTMEMI